MRAALPLFPCLALLALICACSNGAETRPGGNGGALPDAGALPDGGEGGADAGACTPVDPAPPTGPSGYPLDGWAWEKLGVVLEDPSAASSLDGYIAPSAVVVGGALHLFVTRKAGTTHTIHHAESADALTWPAPTACTGLGTNDVVAYPSALHDGSGFRLWYGSGSIKTATSQDGIAWTAAPDSVLSASFESGTFDALSLLYPHVSGAPGGYTMLYTGFDGAGFAIGRATSADGLAWTRDAHNPILVPGGATSWDNAGAAQPHAEQVGGKTLLWYGGYDTSQTNPGPYRVGLAEAEGDGAFSRRGVSLDLGTAGEPDAYTTRDPSVVRWQGAWLMFYVGLDSAYRYRILLARSTTCPP
jgi:predicted GH43/DUF377 family glycosyl hydrolase